MAKLPRRADSCKSARRAAQSSRMEALEAPLRPTDPNHKFTYASVHLHKYSESTAKLLLLVEVRAPCAVIAPVRSLRRTAPQQPRQLCQIHIAHQHLRIQPTTPTGK